MNAVRRLRKQQVGNRLDEVVPHPARDRLDLVEIGPAKPREGAASASARMFLDRRSSP